MITRRQILGAAAAAASASSVPYALAQDGKEMRLIVPIGAGGPLDAMGRYIGEQLGAALKKTVVIDNRGGAAGQLAAGAAAKAVGDPNMLFLGTLGIMGVSPHLYPNLPYDVRRDFTPIVLCARAPNALVVNPNVVPVKTVLEFTRWAKAQKDPIPYATFGSGSVSHIAAEMFSAVASVPMLQVPYKDIPRIQGDLVKGDIPVVFDWPISYVGFAKEDRLRILAITSKTRSAAFPDLPTMDESGYPGFDFANWFALYMPAKVPAAAVEQVKAAAKAIVDSKKFKDQFIPLGFDPTGAAQENFPDFFEREFMRWQDFVRKNNIRITS